MGKLLSNTQTFPLNWTWFLFSCRSKLFFLFKILLIKTSALCAERLNEAWEFDNKDGVLLKRRSLCSRSDHCVYIFYWHRLTFTFYNHMIIFLFSLFPQFFQPVNGKCLHFSSAKTTNYQSRHRAKLCFNIFVWWASLAPFRPHPLFDFEIHNNPRKLNWWKHSLCELLSVLQAVNVLEMPSRRIQQEGWCNRSLRIVQLLPY